MRIINLYKMKKIKIIMVTTMLIVLVMIFFQIPRQTEKPGVRVRLEPHVKQQEVSKENLERKNRAPKPDFYDGLYAKFQTIPFYRNASGIVNTNTDKLFRNYQITIVTQTTVDRLNKVSMMAEKWKAPLSISVFIKNKDKEMVELDEMIKQYPSILYYADIHIFFANKTRYPVNNLRNLAIENSRTDLVFIMDADFLPPIGLHDYIVKQKHYFNINKHNQNNFKYNLLNFHHKKPNVTQVINYGQFIDYNEYTPQPQTSQQPQSQQQQRTSQQPQTQDKQTEQLNIEYNKNHKNIKNNNNNIDQTTATKVDSSRSKNSNIYNSKSSTEDDNKPLKVAFVIPSFSSSEPPNTLPNNKDDMVRMIDSGKVSPSNIKVCKKCHSPTDFDRWIDASEPYEIEYKWIFEPYLVYNKSQGLQFDERLKGYGFDKNSHGFSMAVEGFHFVVLPESFIIHVNHKSSSWEGPSLDEQQWDALRIVCEIIPAIKIKNNYDPNIKLFDEPLVDECFSDHHW